MKIVWSPQSLDDRDAIWEYIAADSPAIATRIDSVIQEAVDGLSDYPELGKPGLVSGTRELLPIHNYRIV